MTEGRTEQLTGTAEVETVPELARLLRRLRRRDARRRGDAPLTYRELATRTGWSRGVIGEYFTGAVLPPTDRFDALVLLLGAGPAEQGALATARDRVEERRRVPRDPGRPVARQLPPDVAAFAGRAEALAELDRIRDGAGRAAAWPVAVISGTAGVGKTALAVHWAQRVADRFPDGQLYVDLAGFEPGGRAVTPARAVRGFLDALGVPAGRIPADPDAQGGLYRSLVAGRRVLVVLDNAREAAHVRPLLPGTPTALTVVTSRDRLTPLVAAFGAHPVTLDVLSPAEARHLLALRLGDERMAAEPDAVAAIVAGCARLPLALAVAAARARQSGFPLAAIAGELADSRRRLDALDGGDLSSQVRAVFSWSYTALTPAAARLFRLLGLHPGPDVSAGAAASLAGLAPDQARPLLAELTRASLLAEPARGRYTYHDLLRAYATELAHRLEQRPARDAALTRLLDHYTHSACAADRRLNAVRDPIHLRLATPAPGALPEHLADAAEAAGWLAVELPVLLAAVRHAAGAGFDAHAWQLAWALDGFVDTRGYWPERTAAWQAALHGARRLGDPTAQAYAHRLLASTAAKVGEHEEADQHAQRALELYTQVADQTGQADAHRHIAVLRGRQGDQRRAVHHAQQALDLYRATGHRHGAASTLNNLGWYHAQLGEHAQALTECGRALELLQQLGDRWGQAGAWDSLGYAHRHLGHHLEAAECHGRALTLIREVGARYEEATVLTHLGDAQHALGDDQRARACWQRALDILTDLDHADAGAVRTRITTATAAHPDRAGAGQRRPERADYPSTTPVAPTAARPAEMS